MKIRPEGKLITGIYNAPNRNYEPNYARKRHVNKQHCAGKCKTLTQAEIKALGYNIG